jgi:hypothetical protein
MSQIIHARCAESGRKNTVLDHSASPRMVGAVRRPRPIASSTRLFASALRREKPHVFFGEESGLSSQKSANRSIRPIDSASGLDMLWGISQSEVVTRAAGDFGCDPTIPRSLTMPIHLLGDASPLVGLRPPAL